MSWLSTRFKALQQLGPRAVTDFTWHQLGVRSGWLRWRTPPGGRSSAAPEQLKLAKDLLPLPVPADLRARLGEAAANLLAEADEIRRGQVRLFGGPAAPLVLELPAPLQHWTAYEHGLPYGTQPGLAQMPEDAAEEAARRAGDIKFTWEPGRFGWAYTLARAYILSGDESYTQCFWSYSERFLAAHPPNLGPHWASAQEVALRLLALVFAGQVFTDSPHTTPARRLLLARALAHHADRIPPTLAYARAQNNNHLISEAAGLYTAGLTLPAHPHAARWQALGWRWLNHALQAQIAPSGAYCQHSANYHRLVLHIAVWVDALARQQGQAWPTETCQRLAAATRWLLALCDPASGQAPNLGPNDGALVLPLSACPFADYRPTLQAAALAFLGAPAFPPGPWDEPTLWLGLDETRERQSSDGPAQGQDPLVLHAAHGSAWAYLRAARFTSRPGHADQLHLDLWWRGLNLAQDAGTYFYNANPPWENSLTHSAVHNTLTVSGLEQMRRVGRFLYLDWAQALDIQHMPTASGAPGSPAHRISAAHDGYRRLGLLHRRSVECRGLQWLVQDTLEALPGADPARQFSANLHWLLPDWPWEIDVQAAQILLKLHSQHGEVRLIIRAQPSCQPSQAPPLPFAYALYRAGQCISGDLSALPIQGWVSPTYGIQLPALSLIVEAAGQAGLGFCSEWTLPQE